MRIIAALFMFVVSNICVAELVPDAGERDSRLRSVVYSGEEVYRLNTQVGIATVIMLAKGETLDDWFSGDDQSIALTFKGNIVALKPTIKNVDTNLILTTSKGRLYTFSLSSVEENGFFGIRFSYPEDDAKRAAKDEIKEQLAVSLNPDAQTHRNTGYMGTGDNPIKPTEIFDNGETTFIRFRTHNDWPAVFRDSQQGESLVAYKARGNWMILNTVEEKLTLRLGDYRYCILNVHSSDLVDRPNKTGTTSRQIIRTRITNETEL